MEANKRESGESALFEWKIRPASSSDWPATWKIFRSVVRGGDTYAFSPDLDKENARRIWFSPGAEVFVAEGKGRVVGTFYVKPNQPGLGSHVANAGFMVDPEIHGASLGRRNRDIRRCNSILWFRPIRVRWPYGRSLGSRSSVRFREVFVTPNLAMSMCT